MENRRCLLKMVDVAKSFPGVKALDGVNFSLEKGEIHALVGENGAGKTTLMNVLGVYLNRIQDRSSLRARKQISATPYLRTRDTFIHQELNLIDELSVMRTSSLAMNLYRKKTIDWRLWSSSLEILEKLGLDLDPTK